MQGLLRASFAIDRLNRRVGGWVAWLTLGMVLVGSYNAVVRFLERGAGVQLSSNAYIELQWYLFSLVFLFGAPYVLRADAHVRVDVIYGRLSTRARAWIDLLGGLLFLLPFGAFALWMSWPPVRDSFQVREMSPDPGGLARWPIKAAVLPAFALLWLQGLSEVIKRLAIVRGRSPEEVRLEEPALDAPSEHHAPGAEEGHF
jgi:TRAP-type mannitol/chloroaromatic compound transport system permease small subunit